MLATQNKHIVTGMAQGQRAGLITLRSLDRDELPVLFHFGCFKEITCLAGHKTQLVLGIYQRKNSDNLFGMS